jgi:transmembrane sensor
MNTLPPDSQQQIDTQAAHWLLRQQQGLSAGEQAQLQQWLTAAAAHQAAFAQLQAIDQLLAQARPAQRQALRQSLPPMLQPLASPPRSRIPLAAAACLCCAIGSCLWWYQAQQNQPLYSAQLATARGEQRDITLPDGSQLSLDSATRVQVTLYRSHRDTRLLQGQALFSVAHDSRRPFHVLAGTRRVTVLGTRFSVRQVGRSYQVAVAEGRVQVRQYASDADAQRDSAPLQQAILLAGQQVGSQNRLLGSITPQAAAAVAAWRSGRLVFDNTPLSEVIAEFNRYGDSQLQLGDARAGQLRLTGSFAARQPAQFATALPRVLPLSVLRQHGQWWIHQQAATGPGTHRP